MCNLQGFMQSMNGRKNAVDFLALALHGEVAVDFDHGLACWNGVGSINLDFIIVLTAPDRRKDDEGSNQRTAEP